jgi:hypothetical protein
MECPGCDYVDPWYDYKTETHATNEAFGPFWKADIKLTRSAEDWNEGSPEPVIKSEAKNWWDRRSEDLRSHCVPDKRARIKARKRNRK